MKPKALPHFPDRQVAIAEAVVVVVVVVVVARVVVVVVSSAAAGGVVVALVVVFCTVGGVVVPGVVAAVAVCSSRTGYKTGLSKWCFRTKVCLEIPAMPGRLAFMPAKGISDSVFLCLWFRIFGFREHTTA